MANDRDGARKPARSMIFEIDDLRRVGIGSPGGVVVQVPIAVHNRTWPMR
jgi:hypothetical protein